MSISLHPSGEKGRLFIPSVQWTLNKPTNNTEQRSSDKLLWRVGWVLKEAASSDASAGKLEHKYGTWQKVSSWKTKRRNEAKCYFQGRMLFHMESMHKGTLPPSLWNSKLLLADVSVVSLWIAPGLRLLPLLTLGGRFINLFLKQHLRVTANYYRSAAI